MTNNLKATKRESKTAGDLGNLRSKGFIPAILYGGNNPSLKISIEENDTASSIEEKIHILEYEYYPKVIKSILIK